MTHETELLAPAGDFETALAAFEAGADAVYGGLSDFSARAFAKNFSAGELRDLMRVARGRGKRVYVTFNTLVDEADLDEAARRLALLDDIGVDGIIVQDLGIARLARLLFPRLKLHASTQLVAHNLEGVLALKELGFCRVVLARELSLAEISTIVRRAGVEIECFIHGALCYSLSGLCLFSALEKDRSGNRGRCAYCCRGAFGPQGLHPFSMKDLRLGDDARRLAEAGVASLKIEGRMKSALYVASVTRHYRNILDGRANDVTTADLETVFSRQTTKLYLDGRDAAGEVIDPVNLGHQGTPVGVVKRVTKDREGRCWLRFHTARALEKHDGLQIVSARQASQTASRDARPFGFGITLMRTALSRVGVFEVAAGTDVEVLLPKAEEVATVQGGDKVFCAMSNAMKRRFPVPSFRRSDWPGSKTLDVAVSISEGQLRACADGQDVLIAGTFAPAKLPGATYAAVEKAFSKLGDSDYRLGALTLDDPARLYVPMSALNDLRRRLVEQLQAAREDVIAGVEVPESAVEIPQNRPPRACRRVKVRLGQDIPPGTWDEIVLALEDDTATVSPPEAQGLDMRLALGVFTPEAGMSRLRTLVKRALRLGYTRWEAADLATLRLLRTLGVSDVTADWTLYAFNAAALAALKDLGVTRLVASAENDAGNRAFLDECGFDVEFLARQSTPLFISLHKPAADVEPSFAVFRRGGLWVTTRREPRTFNVPAGASSRDDLSWDVP